MVAPSIKDFEHKSRNSVNEIRLSSDLNYQYNILPSEIGGQKYSGTTHTTQRLEEELRQWYKVKIKIEKRKNEAWKCYFFKSYELQTFRKQHSMEYKTASNIRDMTFFLQDAIFQVEED